MIRIYAHRHESRLHWSWELTITLRKPFYYKLRRKMRKQRQLDSKDTER